MKPFLSENFLLETRSAERLYHEYAADMPIFDYHCHLSAKDIAVDRKFENLTSIWLNGDHYKWRAMRANGIDEKYITGDGDDREKFRRWAATVPKTLRNPLYHWTHLELKNPFGITGIQLGPETADAVYDKCSEMLQQDGFSTRGLLHRMKVAVVCTTDDPLDNLEHHRAIHADASFDVTVLPTFRPDRAMAVGTPTSFNQWVDALEATTDTQIFTYRQFLEALDRRHAFFHDLGCRISDHGLEKPYSDAFTETDAATIFSRIRSGISLQPDEIAVLKSAMLFELALMDHDRNWTQQYHLGALRNTNSRALSELGPDMGYDTIGDWNMARDLSRLLDRLEAKEKLAKTILYVLNPRDNEMIAAMIGNYQGGVVPGKIQFGAGWWFNDQKDGIERQINALSSMGLLSRFVGMLTDSRSFLSFSRHAYFKRVLCNLFGNDIEKGELPVDFELIGNTVKDICYLNAVRYFGIAPKQASPQKGPCQ